MSTFVVYFFVIAVAFFFFSQEVLCFLSLQGCQTFPSVDVGWTQMENFLEALFGRIPTPIYSASSYDAEISPRTDQGWIQTEGFDGV